MQTEETPAVTEAEAPAAAATEETAAAPAAEAEVPVAGLIAEHKTPADDVRGRFPLTLGTS